VDIVVSRRNGPQLSARHDDDDDDILRSSTFYNIISPKERLHVTCKLQSDELTNGQAVVHYSGHRLTASHVTRTYAATNDQWPQPLCSPITQFVKNQTVSVQFRSVQLRRFVRGLIHADACHVIPTFSQSQLSFAAGCC